MDKYEGEETLTHVSQIKKYLEQNYIVSSEEIDKAMAEPANVELVAKGISLGSNVYFIGDEIALMELWSEVEDEETNS